MTANSRSKQLLEKTVQTIKSFRMLKPHDTVLAGVSGGPDSVCLLDLLTVLSRRMDLRIGVAHLNHGLRCTEADQDAAFVRALAAKYKLTFYEKKINVRNAAKNSKTSIEAAGRDHRYAFFHEIASNKGFSKIALGHHRDDNAELFLINLFRGSGPRGLGGIPPARGVIIRPLIQAERREIMDYLAENHLAYRSDHSNTDPAFLRNKIRHELLPLLKRDYNPRIEETLNRTSDIFRSEQSWIDAQIDQSLEKSTLTSSNQEQVLRIADLKDLHTAQLRRILRAGIKNIKGDLRGIRQSQVTSAIALLYQNRSEAWIDLPARIRIVKNKDKLIIRREPQHLRTSRPFCAPPVYQYIFPLENLPVHLWIPEIQKTIILSKWQGCSLPDFNNPAIAGLVFFDLDHIRSPLTVRNPGPGDRFIPLGMKGSQKVKDFFINKHIPRPDRPFYPVVASGQNIIWLAGQRISEVAKLVAGTRNILQAEIKTGMDARLSENTMNINDLD